ncbi:MAG: DUF362 domain-containing protein [Desulfobacteraceae bacterium]|nr:MAG: DUF362 domain-containing protein [Desulfobacteraceae bacterium]
MLFKPDGFATTPSLKKSSQRVRCTLFRAINGRPDENLTKTIEQAGGIEKIIDSDDIVLIKPNAQWWNQGAPNLCALKTFIDLIMNRAGGFNGEVVLAENCHRGKTPWNADNSGWSHAFSRNSDLKQFHNYNDLTAHLKKKYKEKFTEHHWIDVSRGGKRVYSPEDGNGYVYCDGTGGSPLMEFNNGAKGKNFRQVIMTYPIFKTDQNTVVDFKNGRWQKGGYTDQPLKFINFAALNHHSSYCGVTSAVKNYLGITDLSGGPDPHTDGKLTDKYHNFHSFPFNKWSAGPEPGMIGAEIGIFMNSIRKANFNITTAEWIGLVSRTETPVARTRAVMACTDPVALDYHAAKYILFPNSKIPVHDPDNKNGPLYQYLKKCAEYGGGILNEEDVEIQSFDFKDNHLQKHDGLIVKGDINWGNNPKMLTKYIVLRCASV